MHTHAMTARTEQPRSSSPPFPTRYVRVPTRLIVVFASSPLAIGVYCLLGRLTLVHKAPIALSAADLTRYDPSLSRGAAERALRRLTDHGWLLASVRAGQKTEYTPTWGTVRGAPLAWQPADERLGRPRHVRAVALDLELLDTLMGKLTPQTHRGAIVTRFLQEPALTLADVGSYACALAGLPADAPSLTRQGLLAHGQPQPLPPRRALIARASQTALEHPHRGLTPQGLRQLGPITPHSATAEGHTLFFVPPDLRATLPTILPPKVIGATDEQVVPDTATGRGTSTTTTPHHEIPREQQGFQGMLLDPPPARTHRRRAGSRAAGHVGTPETETTALLRTLGVLPAQIQRLHDVPLPTVHQALTFVDAQRSVQSRAGYLVHLLRAYHEAGMPIPTPAAHQRDYVDWARIKTAYEAETSVAHADELCVRTTPAAPPPPRSPRDGTLAPSRSPKRGVPARPAEPALARAGSSARDLTAEVCAALRERTVRGNHATVDQLQVHVANGVATVVCDSARAVQHAQLTWRGHLRCILSELGVTAPHRVVVRSKATGMG